MTSNFDKVPNGDSMQAHDEAAYVRQEYVPAPFLTNRGGLKFLGMLAAYTGFMVGAFFLHPYLAAEVAFITLIFLVPNQIITWVNREHTVSERERVNDAIRRRGWKDGYEAAIRDKERSALAVLKDRLQFAVVDNGEAALKRETGGR